MNRSIITNPSNKRVFGACLLSFMLLIAPIASVGAATLRATAPAAKKLTANEKLEAALFEPLELSPVAPPVPAVTATKTDSFPVHPSGKAQPGDQITYDIAITNSGTDATNGTFNDTIDPNTTFVPGSLKVSPVAAPDTYAAEQNVILNVPAPGVLTNDFGTPAPTAVPIVAGPTTAGGTVTLNADGSFTYTAPSAVFTGPDTFTYTATNSGAGGLAPDDTATVTINVDAAPSVTATTPTNGATNQATNTNITITFSEPVNVTGNWFQIVCGTSGTRNVADTVVTGGPTTFTINPNTDFTQAESCTVTVFAAQVTDQDTNDPPDNMSANYVFSFSMDAAPAVNATTPLNGATGVTSNSNLTVTFSEPVNVTGNWFQIVCASSGTRNVADTVVTGGPTTFTINPNVDFAGGELCTVTVFAAQVADQDGNDPPDNMLANFVFSFTTDAAPSVTATTPTNGAIDQTSNTNITITFSEPVNVTGNWFQIVCNASGTRNVADTVVTGGPTTFTVNPNTDFTPGESCTVTVFAAQVADQDGNDPPDNMAANFVFTFSIDSAPTVNNTVPVNGATQVANNANVVLTFSEPVNVTGTWFQVNCATSGIQNTTNAVVTGGPTIFTINFNTDFTNGEACVFTVFAAGVTDQDVNDPPDNMGANHIFSFTIDNAPSVTATTPINGATGVAANTNITITFSETVNVTGNWFQIVCGTQTKNPSDTVVTGGPTTFTINPNTDLLAGNVCQVTVFAAQVTDQDSGDPPDNMAANHVFSFSVPPVAVNDTYAPSIVGNVGVNTDNSTEFSILANDTPTSGVTINTSGTSLQGGTVVVALDGKFMYTPAPGYEGADSFTYTISNASGTSNSATVSFTVAGMIWFINSAAGAGDGRLATPFNSVSSFQAVNDGIGNHPAAGDNIFIYENAASYTGPITLLSNQKLIGQDATATLAAISGVSVPADSFPLPVMNTGAPATTLNSAATTNVVLNAVGTGNTVRGLTVTTGALTTKGISGSSFGTLTTADLIISGSGPALDLTTGSLSGSFNSISSSGGANGIRLSAINSASTIPFGTGALSGATAEEFFITGVNSTVALTYDGTISTTLAGSRPVSISGKTTAGNVTFNGAVSAGTSSSGVNLDNNDGATITFRGGLALTTTTNTAFNAINGGTVEVCDDNPCNPAATGGLVNTLTTTTGTALNVNATTISANELEFRSISSNGAANGIALNTTGALGGLTVSGNGGSCTSAATCTGGAIQNATIGVSLTNTTSPSIDRMFIQNTSDSGVKGTTVTNFTFTNGKIDNSGTGLAAQTSNIAFNTQVAGTENNLSGIVTITGNTLTTAFYHGVDIFNFAGTISDATISNNSITSSTVAASALGSGIRVVAFGSAGATANITKATIANNEINNIPTSVGLQVQCGNANSTVAPITTCGTPGNATNIINITGNEINVPGNGSTVKTGSEGMVVLVNGRGQGNFNISSNNIQQTTGTAISHSAFGLATVTSTVNSNTIVANNTVASQGIGVGTSITAGFGTNTPNMSTTINSNNISQTDGNGILAVARDNATGVLNVTIKSNVVAAPLAGVRPGIRIDAGNATGDNDVCLDIGGPGGVGGNTSAGSGGSQGIGLRKQGTSTTVNAFGVEGMGATSSPGVEAFVDGQNPAGGGTLLISATSGFSNCSSAPNLLFNPDNSSLLAPQTRKNAPARILSHEAQRTLIEAEPETQFARPIEPDLDPAARPSGDTPQVQVSRKSDSNSGTGRVSSIVNQLPASPLVRESNRSTSQVVANQRLASEKLESVPSRKAIEPRGYTQKTFSHHASPKAKPSSVKATAAAKAATTTAPVINPTCGVGTIAICLGTLKAGKTVNIQFKVTINTPFPATDVTNQGSVGFDGGGPVLTDDPSVGGAADPTVTPVQTCTAPPVPANMVAWWSGDDTPRDIAGGNDGTLNGGMGYDLGKVLNGFSLDGTDDFVSAPDSAGLSPTGSISIDAWVNPGTLVADTNGRTIVSKYDTATAGDFSYLLRMNNSGQILFAVHGPGVEKRSVVTPGAITAGVFTHIAATFDNTTDEIKVYINGVDTAAPLEGLSTSITSINDSTTPVRIGALKEGASLAGFFDGVIDEVEIFNVALTPAQVLDIFSADAGGKCKPSDLRITKSHTDPFVQGSTGNTYTITVHNDGPATTSGTTTVTDNLPAGLTATAMSGSGWTCPGPFPATGPAMFSCTSTATIASGADFPVITLTVTAGVNTASVTNTVTVSGGGEMDTSDDTASDLTNLSASADLLSVKVDSPDPVTASTNITYNVTLSNNGPSDAQTVTLTDTVPANTTFVSAIQNTGPTFVCVNPPGGGTGNVSCSIATFATGAVATFTIVVNVNANTPEGTIINNSAVAASTTNDPMPANNTGTAMTTVNQSDIEITSKTDTPDPVTAGQDITYTINFKNNSAVNSASNVTVTDAVPTGTTLVSATTVSPGWARTDGVLAGGTGNIVFSKALVAASETAVFTIVVKVNANVASGSTITNTATAATTSIDTNSLNNSASATTTTAASADLEITSKTDTPDPVIASQNITYAISFVNNGPSDAQTVNITDAVPAGTTFVSASITTGSGWTIPSPPAVGGTGNVVFSKATVAAAETATFEVVVKVNNNAVEGSLISNTATAASATTDPTPANDSKTATTTVNQSDIEITSKTDTPDPVNAGENITYTINFKNNSAVNTASNVTVTDAVPTGTTLVSATTASVGWARTDGVLAGGTGNIVFSKALVAASETATFTIVVKVNANVPSGSTITNTATAATTSVDTNSANNSKTATTTTQASADVEIVSNTDTPDPVTAGSNITYTINFRNNGPSDAIRQCDLSGCEVVVTSGFIPNTTFVSATVTSGTGWSITSQPAVGGTGQVDFSKDPVAAGETATFTVVVKVNSNTPAATVISNTASFNGGSNPDPNPGNNSKTATTTVVTSADLLVVKVDSPSPVGAGQNLTYTITVTNGGSSDAQNLSLSDTLPPSTTLVSFTVPAGWTRTDVVPVGGTGTVTATAPTLISGASAVFTLVVNVNAATPHNTVLTNSATGTSTTADPNPVNNTGTVMTTVVSQPDLTITKTHSGNFAQGQVGATYTITVSNSASGPTNGSPVTVTDTVPVGLTPTGPVGLHNGWTCAINGQTLTCTRSDVLAGNSSYPSITLTVNVANPAPLTVTNTATVSGGGEVNTSNNSASDPTNIDCAPDFSLNNTGPLMISRFRMNGPGGAQDEFVEIYNPSTTDHTVASGNCGGGGYGVFASAGNGTNSNTVSMVCQIPNGTVIPAGGYYLCTGATYSLSNLGRNGGAEGATSVSDAPIGCGGSCVANIPDDAGLALLNVAQGVTLTPGGGFLGGVPDAGLILYDKVGFGPYGAGAPAPGYPSLAGNFCEGGACLKPVGDASTGGSCTNPSGLFPVVSVPPACYGLAGQYELLRRQTAFDPNLGTVHLDTNNSENDWILVAPNSAINMGLGVTGVLGVTAVHGAAGPQGSTAPADTPSTSLKQGPFDSGTSQLGSRNAERSYGLDPTIVDPADNPGGTFSLRLRFTNNSGSDIAGLRFRVDQISTLCGSEVGTPVVGSGSARNLASAPDCGTGSLTAILKLLNSAQEVVIDGTETAYAVNGTVIEDLSASATPTPPGAGPLSPKGGGLDNSFIVNPSSADASVGDGVTGGTGVFATAISTTDPNNVIRIKIKFGVVKSGRFILLITPAAKTAP
jgi:uncharacterized repeat protein (TIGR01451 family)